MPTAIEMGIFARVKIDNRTYKMCTNTDKDIVAEMHFLLTCDLYDDLWEILFNKMLEAIPDLWIW